MKIDEFLDTKCSLQGWRESTWCDWFKDVLRSVLIEGEGFSGKRPNCNSGWQDELAAGLSQIDPSVVESWEENEGEKVPLSVNKEVYCKLCNEIIEFLSRRMM